MNNVLIKDEGSIIGRLIVSTLAILDLTSKINVHVWMHVCMQAVQKHINAFQKLNHLIGFTLIHAHLYSRKDVQSAIMNLTCILKP